MPQELKSFSFTYARSSAGVSLSHNLSYEPHQVIWLVGSSGSGKSTLLHLLKGFHPEFLAGEMSGHDPAVFKDAMYMAQNPISQIVHERVGEEFFFTLENQHATVESMHAARHWLAEFGLQNKELSATAQLSHGLAQRLVLASQLAAEPTWLLLDEPTAFLNPAMRDEFYHTLKSLKRRVGMVLIDHHPHAAEFADICWHIDAQGQVTAMPVDEWMALQAQDVQQEIEQPTDDWYVERLNDAFELSAQDLCIGYKKNPLFSANFSLKSGECAVLIGDNGAGKSTLFNTLAGMHKPLSGVFFLKKNGACVKNATAEMAYVFQHPDSHFYFDTIAEDLSQLGVTDMDTTLAQIGLPHTAARSPHQLSEGQKRRLTLLYPCLQSRPLVLLDEPTFGQDAINTLRITRLILALKRAGHIVIVITHESALQHTIADQVWLIQHNALNIIRTAHHVSH
ncbi:Putative HMP/thiamine import ATP-binding protein YkoD [Ephemeroptericola cinctiostellae]|uniref:HMP/thiamine import ATP-binding protein YkoD n=1 Tax=Ephemeroptericola cinctiostellae TaxID=2268024 RepID=A0A345DCT7_9BURK|nr:ABC transporter ATP-binding protein [Ephemeroptericola cinctiostellae]AXF86175.1 Putative HMP/thiamine import ATP-binding protein YkoD [Ephemeroptericola cinctiostellae]